MPVFEFDILHKRMPHTPPSLRTERSEVRQPSSKMAAFNFPGLPRFARNDDGLWIKHRTNTPTEVVTKTTSSIHLGVYLNRLKMPIF
jgi:hypothetical protein